MDFPTENALQATNPSQYGASAFVTKLTPDGSGIVYSTYLGGTEYEQAVDVAIDSVGSAYVTGYAAAPDYPTTANAYARNCTLNVAGCSGDAFLAKLTPDGAGLAYSS